MLNSRLYNQIEIHLVFQSLFLTGHYFQSHHYKRNSHLSNALRKVNASGKKTLVLLCGSAGDGKSHLLSYLKNLDEEHLIDDYFVFNDATESSPPLAIFLKVYNSI